MDSSARIPGFYRLSVTERVRAIHARGLISTPDCEALLSGRQVLSAAGADKLIENVVGVIGLPVGLALNFIVNGKDRLIPMVVEEPSIVAGLSSAAKSARHHGGFTAQSDLPILIGQVQIMGLPNPQEAAAALHARSREILDLANSLHPRMAARGGGAGSIETQIHQTPSGQALVLHLLVDTRDAMGANLVNTMCEGVAPLAEEITGGQACLRILSNLTDRCLVKARFSIPIAELATENLSGEEVRDRIILACDLAKADPHRAATHNKGIMNGIDAVAIATGNDWRALEAAAHAYAARDGRYGSLTHYEVGPDGELIGMIETPLKVGIVGGSLESNPAVALNLRLLGAQSATELGEIMACVGLAQNFAALRALATAGIQRGHMTLHARSVAASAGAPPQIFDEVVSQLIKSGEIKVWKASQIIADLKSSEPASSSVMSVDHEGSDYPCGHGKIILLGEHAVVYGSRALAIPLLRAVSAKVTELREGLELAIPAWGISQRLSGTQATPFRPQLELILQRLDLRERSLRIEILPRIPKAAGLGASAATAVAVIRALSEHFQIKISEAEINDIALACEKIAHGTPSGVDNTVAVHGHGLCFQRQIDGSASFRKLKIKRRLPLVIGYTGAESLTAETVSRVRAIRSRNPARYDRIFGLIDELAGGGLEALEQGNLTELGELMNLCQGYLNALQVSSPEIERLAQIARSSGALGAKLTGGGGGGAVIALCEEDTVKAVADSIRSAGFDALEVAIG